MISSKIHLTGPAMLVLLSMILASCGLVANREGRAVEARGGSGKVPAITTGGVNAGSTKVKVGKDLTTVERVNQAQTKTVSTEAEASERKAVERITLENSAVKLAVTPDIGGRVLEFGLQGHPNFLKVGEAVATKPAPDVNANSPAIPYYGHMVWLSPQSAWWQQQTVHQGRLAQRALWPPDPYLVLARNEILEQTPYTVLMRGPASSVSGVRMAKRVSLDSLQPNKVHLSATITNTRSTPVAWGLWFNTRVKISSRVIVPVAPDVAVTYQDFTDPDSREPIGTDAGFLVLDPQSDQRRAQGKYRIQPSAGWMAAVEGEQLFIIQFEPVAAHLIHPEQGQVEIYVNRDPNNPADEVVEMEMHRPWRTLVAGSENSAQQTWRLLPVAVDMPDNALIELIERHVNDTL